MDELLARMTAMQQTLDSHGTALTAIQGTLNNHGATLSTIQLTLHSFSDSLLGQARLVVPRLPNARGERPPPEHFPSTWDGLANLPDESVDALLRHYDLHVGPGQDPLEVLTRFFPETRG